MRTPRKPFSIEIEYSCHVTYSFSVYYSKTRYKSFKGQFFEHILQDTFHIHYNLALLVRKEYIEYFEVVIMEYICSQFLCRCARALLFVANFYAIVHERPRALLLLESLV